MSTRNDIRALLFDVFGTVVDWRGTIVREGELEWAAYGVEANWSEFADDWRAGYQPALDRVRRGERDWVNLDVLHREVLNSLLVKFGLTQLAERQLDQINQVWHRLASWPDAVQGLERLRQHFVLAPLSNGHMALLTRLSKRAGLPWDCILSAELAWHYKPDAEVYVHAARLLGLLPAQIMMVAAHEDDLVAAQQVGMKTAFVRRPLEYGPNTPVSSQLDRFDVVADDFIDLHIKLTTSP
jgi:2-haloacid dehalogenase